MFQALSKACYLLQEGSHFLFEERERKDEGKETHSLEKSHFLEEKKTARKLVYHFPASSNNNAGLRLALTCTIWGWSIK